MTEYKKKIIALLVTAVIVGGILVVYSTRSHLWRANQSQPEKSKLNVGSFFAGEPNLSKNLVDSSGNQELFFKMMLSVLLVVALGAVAIYISRKVLPRITNLPGKEIHIIETVHLGPRKALHLLRIGSRWLLVGSTNENITKLADVTDALADLSTQEIRLRRTGRGTAKRERVRMGSPEYK
jgi:flagellar biogenesis protein FliO